MVITSGQFTDLDRFNANIKSSGKNYRDIQKQTLKVNTPKFGYGDYEFNSKNRSESK